MALPGATEITTALLDQPLRAVLGDSERYAGRRKSVHEGRFACALLQDHIREYRLPHRVDHRAVPSETRPCVPVPVRKNRGTRIPIQHFRCDVWRN